MDLLPTGTQGRLFAQREHYADQLDLMRLGHTQCAHMECSALLDQSAISSTYFDGSQEVTKEFCGQTCKEAWYLNHLRSGL